MARKALITGGGGAIAEEIAIRLDKRGYDLILADINEARMAEVAKRLSRTPLTIRADLSTTEGVAALASAIEQDHSDLALLVNNAGFVEPGDIDALPPEALDRHIFINLIAPMQLTRAAARIMRPRKSGDILSIVSMGGIIALRGSAAYAASKFGLRGFQTSVRSELRHDGVRVMGVFPSGVDTPMLRYEATHDGSPLNFVGTVLTAAQVADACMKALDTGRLETYIPYGDSITSRLMGAFPWLIDKVLSSFEKSGEKGRAKFLAERGLKPER
ncbi:SDR family NAD(P)-dependent oxidoreductase [Parvibaculum sp.]|uniref:SDR family NAD(P)-dependent oxidoreductase n=1 Tax=Parvibaculum sp. TaxID=2024848 RepID=UPI002BD192D7|nr:SDR family NAD(P)-dependent oxidoreductase [Parvibaculum sp.]HUD50962.1 SDR family NAD(P)-dependent oxidoreductase [Parvibaculum sp.]